MYTQCPDCGTVFRVTATVLRAAHGQVRCGVCDATFDAIAFLTEHVEPLEPARRTQAETSGPPVEPASQAAQPGVTEATAATAPTAQHEHALGAIAALIARAAAADAASLHAAPPAEAGRAAESEPRAGADDLVEGEIVLEDDIPLDVGTSAPAVPLPDTDWLFEDESAAEVEASRAAESSAGAESRIEAGSSAERGAPPAHEIGIDTDRALVGEAFVAGRAEPETEWLIEAAAVAGAEAVGKTVGATGAGAAPVPAAADEPAAGAAALNDSVGSVLATTDDIPDSALEFNAAVADWNSVFVADQSAIRLSTLDVELTATQFETPDDGEDPLAVTGEYPPLQPAAGPHADAEPALSTGVLPAAAAGPSAPASVPSELRNPGTSPAALPDYQSDADLAALRRRNAGQPDRSPATATDAKTDAAALVASGRAATPRSPAGLGLAAGAVLLALGLGAQAVHYWRDSLAGQPLIGPPLARLYARLAEPLEPRWSLAAYDVKQWGAASDARPGALRVRASVVNRATEAQPYPLLRVTFVDRFGGQVARRDFRPAEYLPGRAAPTQLLAAGARADADLSIVDPGTQAAGFELDVCLARHGVTTCGSELRLASSGS